MRKACIGPVENPHQTLLTRAFGFGSSKTLPRPNMKDQKSNRAKRNNAKRPSLCITYKP